MNECKLKNQLKGHSDSVWSLAIFPNGDLASGSRDKTIIIWDLNECKLKNQLKGHSSWVSSIAILPNSDLASGSDDKQ